MHRLWSLTNHRVSDWTFERDNEIVTHVPKGSLHFNSSEAAIEIALEDGGIIYMPDLLVRNHIRAGRLVPLLGEWSTRERPIYLVYPDKRYVPMKVRAFAGFIETLFARLDAAPAPGRKAAREPVDV